MKQFIKMLKFKLAVLLLLKLRDYLNNYSPSFVLHLRNAEEEAVVRGIKGIQDDGNALKYGPKFRQTYFFKHK